MKSDRKKLTPREIELAFFTAQGFIAKEIAEKLGIKESTVKTHLSAAREKTGAKTTAHLIYMLFCEVDE